MTLLPWIKKRRSVQLLMQPYKGIYVFTRKKKNKKLKNVKEIKDLEKEIKRLCSLKTGSSCISGCWCTRERCKEIG